MKILVLLKEVPDTWGPRRIDPSTGRLDRDDADPIMDEIGERALEAALRYADEHSGTEIVALTMGRSSANAMLRKALAMGAHQAVHVEDDRLSGSDLGWTAVVLAAAVRTQAPDLVIAGNESTDGRGGVIPVMLAEHLGLPVLAGLQSLAIAAGVVQGELTDGSRSLVVRAPLPAVVSVTERLPEARFPSFKGRMSAKKKPLSTIGVADLGVADLLDALGRSVVLGVKESQARVAGVKVKDDGSAAQQLVAFLTDRELVAGRAS